MLCHNYCIYLRYVENGERGLANIKKELRQNSSSKWNIRECVGKPFILLKIKSDKINVEDSLKAIGFNVDDTNYKKEYFDMFVKVERKNILLNIKGKMLGKL